MKTIEVKSCGECPLLVENYDYDACAINSEIKSTCLPINQVHENCPLKNESVTVKLKEESNDTSK